MATYSKDESLTSGVPYTYVLCVFGLAGRRRRYRLLSVFVQRGCLVEGSAVGSGWLVVLGGTRLPGSVFGTSECPTGRLCPVCVCHVALAALGWCLVCGCRG